MWIFFLNSKKVEQTESRRASTCYSSQPKRVQARVIFSVLICFKRSTVGREAFFLNGCEPLRYVTYHNMPAWRRISALKILNNYETHTGSAVGFSFFLKMNSKKELKFVNISDVWRGRRPALWSGNRPTVWKVASTSESGVRTGFF